MSHNIFNKLKAASNSSKWYDDRAFLTKYDGLETSFKANCDGDRQKNKSATSSGLFDKLDQSNKRNKIGFLTLDRIAMLFGKKST